MTTVEKTRATAGSPNTRQSVTFSFGFSGFEYTSALDTSEDGSCVLLEYFIFLHSLATSSPACCTLVHSHQM
jgi:hypothetical protein